MVCDPVSDSNIFPPILPGLPNFAPSLPSLNIPFRLPLEDLSELFKDISMILPSGTLKPNLHVNIDKDFGDGLKSLLEQFMPFLSLYTFFMPVLNIILCIIEVLCSIKNPIKMIRAMIHLFRDCIPELLSLFPFFALIIMIISLILLIIALIEYIINRIIAIIEQIIKNILILANATKRFDNDSIIAITKKIGDLLCILQNLFVIMGVILIIIQLIQALLQLVFKIPPCSDSDSDGCCTTDVCPSFIRNNSTITSSVGTFQYLNEAAIHSGLVLPVGFAPITSVTRSESWQFFDGYAAQPLQFYNITQPFDLGPGFPPFFPSGVSYDQNTPPSTVPYTLDMRLFYNPGSFGRTDPKGARFVRINGCIVQKTPNNYVINYNNVNVSPNTGTLIIIGGLVFEDDGTTPISLEGFNQSTLTSFIHMDPKTASSAPPLLPTDGYTFSNVEYTFNINHESLLTYDLITLGCIPEVALNKNFINDTIAIPLANNQAKLNAIQLPDINETTDCVNTAISKFRESISVESSQTFQNSIISCLNKLQTDSKNALQAVIEAGFDPTHSDFVIDPIIQFTTLPITVSVILNENTGKNMASNIPVDVAAELAQQISSNITLGSISNFTYDGTANFIAEITSDTPGNGTIEIGFDNNLISILNNPTDINVAPSVEVKVLTYTFVSSGSLDISGGTEGKPRRDDGDISREGSA